MTESHEPDNPFAAEARVCLELGEELLTRKLATRCNLWRWRRAGRRKRSRGGCLRVGGVGETARLKARE